MSPTIFLSFEDVDFLKKYFVSTYPLFPFMFFVNFEKKQSMCQLKFLSEQEIPFPPDKTMIGPQEIPGPPDKTVIGSPRNTRPTR